MIKRTISQKVRELKDKYPVVSLTGPRQSGKTSLVLDLFPGYKYQNLENLDTLALATSDPKSFLRLGTGERLIVDEIQKYPDLLSYIQVEVDKQKIDGQYVITGSQNFEISQSISQSLAGRVANFTLLPLSVKEITESEYGSKSKEYVEIMLEGFYPRALVKAIKPDDFYRDYLATYVERDVRQIKNIGDLSTFQRFLQLLAGRVGQLVNLSSLSNDVGVNYKTIESWLSILEASYIAFTLQPYFENFGKRVIKSPKVYFYDVGLLCYLLRINTKDELTTHFAFGNIFENLIIAEMMKHNFNLRKNSPLYFWRDSNGNEVDVVVDEGGNKPGIEIKAAKTYNPGMLKGLKYWLALKPTIHKPLTLVYGGDEEQNVGEIKVVNWNRFVGQLT